RSRVTPCLRCRRWRGRVREPTREEELGLAVRAELFDELVEVAFDDAIELVERDADPVVGEAILREVVSANLLRALAGADHGAALGTDCRLLLLAFDIHQARAQNLERLRLILQL